MKRVTSKGPGRVELNDVAHFRITSIKPGKKNWVLLKGVFNHLEGVRKECQHGFLYVSRQDSVYGELKSLDRKTREASFLGRATRKKLRVGLALPFVDRYFDAAQVARALEPASLWEKVRFRPQTMVRYRDPAAPGWWTSHTLDRKVSAQATEVHYVEGGWDHEHCNLCLGRIGVGGNSHGYFKKVENVWLCQGCYKKFIARHDLRFLQFK